ncbi:MAG TPA: dTDP-Rha--alpha-D-GlcNAc-pyrophosphate polyprenol alpha-3-L-rhamnosyltransferase [Prolixibacteraceae bacterium]|nr:dTDP-Rha--alpha-D-GlcNAc-pyrophosphate polyprenol alpha-3-L-rhamnosyltransferase [Prolixibacteraceae bacterium]
MSSSEQKYPLVSIITVNYNQSAVTMDLLSSLRKITYPSFETIVVDNSSPNDDPQDIKNKFPEIELIISNKNLGFAGGNNLGVKASKGKYLLFLNNDTEVPPGFLEPLVNLFENDETIGMVSPKIKFHWNPDIVQYAGFSEMNRYTIRNKGLGYHKKDGPEVNDLKETASIHGAAMMVPRKVIKEVGMMTEVYFLYYEEHDWAEKIKKAGYKIVYQPASYILHKESVSTGKDSPFKTYFITRNRILFARRNFSGFPFLASMLFQAFVSLPKNSAVFLLKGRFKHLSAYWRGVFWNLTHYRNLKSNPQL